MGFRRKCILLGIVTILYCEFVADLVAVWDCSFPVIKPTEKTPKEEILRAMILADTHLLGPLRGHWLDKFYREWHMKNSFQAAIAVFRPEVIFILGDLFDEGDAVSHKYFGKYVIRFHQHFRTPKGVPIISAVGNHDIGFHYKIQPFFIERFEKHFNNTGVNLYTIKNNHFVFVNSMAMENDGCHYCEEAMAELEDVAEYLRCLSPRQKCAKSERNPNIKYSRPILMQHFPTYRASDKVCYETDTEKFEKFRENWEVLSKVATDLLGRLLKPRLSFAGHSHNYCHSRNRWGIHEYTVASFNWRNKVNPSFLLASFTPTGHKINKCNMLEQPTVYKMYCVTLVIWFFLLIHHVFIKIRQVRRVRLEMIRARKNAPYTAIPRRM